MNCAAGAPESPPPYVVLRAGTGSAQAAHRSTHLQTAAVSKVAAPTRTAAALRGDDAQPRRGASGRGHIAFMWRQCLYMEADWRLHKLKRHRAPAKRLLVTLGRQRWGHADARRAASARQGRS